MHSARTLEGSSFESMLLPPFRKVEYQEDFPQAFVTTQLRHAWIALPGQASTSGTVGQFMKANHERAAEENAAVPQNPDHNTVHTAWRDEIYENWNHLFLDVSRFLQGAGVGIGHLHPPSQEVFALEYPQASSDEREVGPEVKKWDTDVLIIPTYLAPGVQVKMTMLSADSADEGASSAGKTLGTFNGENTAEIWYVRPGVEVSFHLEGSWEEHKEGVAAVLVCGLLCQDEHWDPSQQTQEA